MLQKCIVRDTSAFQHLDYDAAGPWILSHTNQEMVPFLNFLRCILNQQ